MGGGEPGVRSRTCRRWEVDNLEEVENWEEVANLEEVGGVEPSFICIN